MGMSDDEVRERFRTEPGVIRLTDENAGKKRKRMYVTLRIPEEVLQRVERRLSVEGGTS
jgi:predicted DNA binding CopG/RHH family protein